MEQTIQQTGYSQRPMNARSQTFNRYLDSCIFRGQRNLTTGTSGGLTTSTSRTTTGKLAFDNATLQASGFVIPKDGTYIISASGFTAVTSSTTSTGSAFILISHLGVLSGGVYPIIETVYGGIYGYGNQVDGRGCSAVYVANFIKGEQVNIGFDNATNTTITLSGTASITKLS